MKIVDTVYLVAYFRVEDPCHKEAREIIEKLGDEVKISEASLIEFDLLLGSRGFTLDERFETWMVLNSLIDDRDIEVVTPKDLFLATYMVYKYGIDYFDSIISAQCIIRRAIPITTDREILEIIKRGDEILKVLKRLYNFEL